MNKRYINKTEELAQTSLLKLFREFMPIYNTEKRHTPIDKFESEALRLLNNRWRDYVNKVFKKHAHPDLFTTQLRRFKVLIASFILKHYYGIQAPQKDLFECWDTDVNEICIKYMQTI